MSKLTALLLGVLTACAAADDSSPDPRAPAPPTVVAEDDEMYAQLLAADEAWEAAAGVRPEILVILPPGSVGANITATWHARSEVAARCGDPGGGTLGCWDPHQRELLIANDGDESIWPLALIVRHELGHVLRAAEEPAHLPEEACNGRRGAATMCDGSRARMLTELDVDFVCTSSTQPCRTAAHMTAEK